MRESQKQIFRGRTAIETEKIVPFSTLKIDIGESSR